MKQIEIDSEIHQWFEATNRVKNAEFVLREAKTALENCTNMVAKRLLPDDAKEGEIYIFPSTRDLAVRCSLRPEIAFEVATGKEVKTLKPHIEPHDFNRK